MQGKCPSCGDQAFKVASDQIFRHGARPLSSFLQREVKYACSVCGEIVQWGAELLKPHHPLAPISLRSRTRDDVVDCKRVSIAGRSSDRHLVFLEYPAVFRVGENVLIPTSEGTVQDASAVDRYGDPDLMADFAEEYLRQFRIIMPTGRLPHSLKETMPALLLLFTATELAMKAYLIRSETSFKRSHSLVELYRKLDPEHTAHVEHRFARSELVSASLSLGVDGPKVTDILRTYSETYGGASSVYMDARYYAEPTMMFPKSADLRGANMIKGQTPYPIFFPDVVRALIDAYRYYSGAERLRRLGADLVGGFRDSGNDNHGYWGLIPSSLGLVVVSVPQRSGMDAQGQDLRVYESFKKMHAAGFCADWMYGGNTLLFYRGGPQRFLDGKAVIDGLECRVWRKGRLGQHSRELYRLADVLERASKGEDILKPLASAVVEGCECRS